MADAVTTAEAFDLAKAALEPFASHYERVTTTIGVPAEMGMQAPAAVFRRASEAYAALTALDGVEGSGTVLPTLTREEVRNIIWGVLDQYDVPATVSADPFVDALIAAKAIRVRE